MVSNWFGQTRLRIFNKGAFLFCLKAPLGFLNYTKQRSFRNKRTLSYLVRPVINRAYLLEGIPDRVKM